jgi:type IV pilus assembly protein PilM
VVDWKKEIKLGKRASEPAPAAAEGEAPAAEEKVPFWKKEIGGGRKPKAQAPPQPVTLEPEAEVAPEPVAVPEAQAEPEAAQDPDGYGWLTAGIDQQSTDLRSWAETTLAEIEAEIQAEAAATIPTPEPVADVEPEPIPEPPAAAAPPAPVPPPGIHPPVPAAELPPLPEEPSAAKQPFWKRELSFGRKGATDVAVEAEQPVEERAEKVPFWKKELGGKRTPKAEKPPKAEKQPKAKREQQPKAEKAPKEPREKRPKAPRQPRAKSAAKGTQRHKQLVGLKVGGSQLAAARVHNNGHAEVAQLAREPLEAGVVVGGELRDPEALAEALKAFFAKHKLPKRNVRLGIANNRIGVRTLEVVGIEDPKQLANAIRFRAQEALPIPIEEAVLDYHVLSEGTNEEGESVRRVLLVVAYRELVDRYLDACRRAGVRLVGIDLEAFALLRALAPPREEGYGSAGSALVAVAIGHDRTTFAVSDGRACEFTRVLEWGGYSLNVAVARALDVTPSAAEPVKRALSLHGSEIVDDLAPEQAEAAREAMRKQVNTFARELVSSLQFYQGQPGSLPIGSITLTGGTAHLGGLAEELERLIGVSVVVGDPLTRVELGKKVEDEEQLGSFAIAIGLGIED